MKQEVMGVALASAGPYANHLCLIPDKKKPCDHLLLHWNPERFNLSSSSFGHQGECAIDRHSSVPTGCSSWWVCVPQLSQTQSTPNITPSTASSMIWEPTTSHRTNQSNWPRTVPCGGWCLLMALHTPSGACQKRRRRSSSLLRLSCKRGS